MNTLPFSEASVSLPGKRVTSPPIYSRSIQRRGIPDIKTLDRKFLEFTGDAGRLCSNAPDLISTSTVLLINTVRPREWPNPMSKSEVQATCVKVMVRRLAGTPDTSASCKDLDTITSLKTTANDRAPE